MSDDHDISTTGRLWRIERELAKRARNLEIQADCLEVQIADWPAHMRTVMGESFQLMQNHVHGLRQLASDAAETRRLMS